MTITINCMFSTSYFTYKMFLNLVYVKYVNKYLQGGKYVKLLKINIKVYHKSKIHM